MALNILRSRPTPLNSILFLCDVQERFRPLIHNMESVVAQSVFMNDVCKTLQIPRLVTEQYSKAFGKTVPELTDESMVVYEKKKFSMLIPEVVDYLSQRPQVTNVLLCGIEAHVCVQQTALDLLENNYNVHLICDAISSQKPYDRTVALSKMQQLGCVVTTSQSMAFELMRTADHPNFKAISNLVKNQYNEEFKDRQTL